jgi:hypothetical protein
MEQRDRENALIEPETASTDNVSHWPPEITTRCADCGAGTLELDEWYAVRDHVWAQAWAGRYKWRQPHVDGQMVLCIGCLEQRLGCELCAGDFADAPINDPAKLNMSARLRDRLRRSSPHIAAPPPSSPPRPATPPPPPKKKARPPRGRAHLDRKLRPWRRSPKGG